MSTSAIRIEALLNSRLLCPLSNDRNDLVASNLGNLGNFLIGELFSSLLESYDENYDLNLKSSRVSNGVC